jgi:hypothetical protein
MAGEFSALTNECLKGEYEISNSFTIPPSSYIIKNIVFHNNKWFDQTHELYRHNFKKDIDNKYEVTVCFYKDLEKQPRFFHLFVMPILKRNEESNRCWEFWYRRDDWGKDTYPITPSSQKYIDLKGFAR